MTVGQGSDALSITKYSTVLCYCFAQPNVPCKQSASKCAFLYSVNFRMPLNLQFNRASQLTAVLMEIKLVFCCFLVLFAFGSTQEVAHSFTAHTRRGRAGKSPGVIQTHWALTYCYSCKCLSNLCAICAPCVCVCVFVVSHVIAVKDVQTQDTQRQKSNKCTMFWLQ